MIRLEESSWSQRCWRRNGTGVFARMWIFALKYWREECHNGMLISMNLSRLESTFPSFVIGLGIGNSAVSWYHWVDRCRRCSRMVTHQEGVFCANYGSRVPGFPLCRNVWCATCYRTLPGDDFLIYRVNDATDEAGNVDLLAPEESEDFLQARPGDCLLSSQRSSPSLWKQDRRDSAGVYSPC